MQHGKVSVHSHSISVAECSLSIREKLQKLGIRSEERDIIRGALLHDYFLYDWHNHIHKKGWRNLHGFTHPETALNNARKEYHQKAYVAAHIGAAAVQGSLDCDGGG